MSVSSRDSKVCIYYLKGSCVFGQKCNKAHVNANGNAEVLHMDSKTTHSIPSTASTDVCIFRLQGKCAFGCKCVPSHSTGNGMAVNGATQPGASLKTSPAICTHYSVGKCMYGDSCHQLHSSLEDQLKIAQIKAARAEIDDLLFGRLKVNNTNDESSFTEVRSLQRNGPKEISKRLGEAEKPTKPIEVPSVHVKQKKILNEENVKKSVQQISVSNLPQIKKTIDSKPVGKFPGTLRLIEAVPSKTKEPSKQALKCTNKQNVVKDPSSKKTTNSSEKPTETKIPKPVVLPDLVKKESPKPEVLSDLDKNEGPPSEENAEEEEEEIADVLEDRKLTKKEQKRQDRLLMALAKKKLKHKSCEIIPEVKDQMLEAFNLLEEKKTDEAIVAFNKIVNESTWQPYHKEALLGLCRCYREMDNYLKAFDYVTSAMSKDSSQTYFVMIKHRDEFAIEIAGIQLAFGQINSARRSLSSVSDTSLLELVNNVSQNLAEAESMQNKLVKENLAMLGGLFNPEEFMSVVDHRFEHVKFATEKIIEKLRESMIIAKKCITLRLLELECYILLNLKKESDKVIAEIRKEDPQESDSKKLAVLLILYEYVFVFEWSHFPKLKPMDASPIVDLGDRFDEAANEVDGAIYQRWKYYKHQVFPSLKELEAVLLNESRCLDDKKIATINLIYLDISSKGLTSRLLAILARMELGPPHKLNAEICVELSFWYLNGSIRLRPSHTAFFDRARGFKLLGKLKEAEEDFRSSIYHKSLIQFPNHEEFFY